MKREIPSFILVLLFGVIDRFLGFHIESFLVKFMKNCIPLTNLSNVYVRFLNEIRDSQQEGEKKRRQKSERQNEKFRERLPSFS